MKMTIAAALRRIKKLKGEIATLDGRIRHSACHIEGKEPPFAFEASTASRREKVAELTRLQTLVAVSNARTSFAHGGMGVLSVEAIKRLDEIKSEIALLNGLPIRDRVRDVEIESESEWDDASRRSVTVKKEIVHLSAMSRVAQAEAISKLTAEFEALNVALEACNHSTFIDS